MARTRTRSRLLPLWALPGALALSGCDDASKADSGTVAPSGDLSDFIGAPCSAHADCPYAGGICLPAADGFPGGMCSVECDRYCPDDDAHPTTFCVDRSALPRKARDLVRDGACVSRCSYAAYPEGGCREGYGCTREARIHEPDRETWTCLPGAPDGRLPSCYQELADRGVAFEPDIRPPDTVAGSSRQCFVDDAVWLERSVLGVDLVYAFDASLDTTLAACSLGLALADTADDLRPRGVTELHHMGTYACRTVSGTSTLSRHAYGDAIDISGFRFADGRTYTLVGDWEHDTTRYTTSAGRWLFDVASGWHTRRLWSVILTPNYNAAHDDHFHVDLTPGSHSMARTCDGPASPLVPAGYFGPAPYAD